MENNKIYALVVLYKFEFASLVGDKPMTSENISVMFFDTAGEAEEYFKRKTEKEIFTRNVTLKHCVIEMLAFPSDNIRDKSTLVSPRDFCVELK